MKKGMEGCSHCFLRRPLSGYKVACPLVRPDVPPRYPVPCCQLLLLQVSARQSAGGTHSGREDSGVRVHGAHKGSQQLTVSGSRHEEGVACLTSITHYPSGRSRTLPLSC